MHIFYIWLWLALARVLPCLAGYGLALALPGSGLVSDPFINGLVLYWVVLALPCKYILPGRICQTAIIYTLTLKWLGLIACLA
jgi:hypothetical protein